MEPEKIFFVYPTLIRAGMAANGTYLPGISIKLNQKGTRHLMVITAGIMFRSVGMYFTEIDIQHEEKSIISNPTKSGKMDLLFADQTKNYLQLNIYSMFASSLNLDEDGLYRVIVKIYHSENGDKTGEPIDQKDCFFFVSHDEETVK
ncbi:hypothetical protein [Sodalis sp. dw_96]|uniref:hypothetical protein n=1 Tax=Sodalis sp. dw_96 TaxID=2719794 RepID=UPI001BD34E7E|nr:hypothetical protein [Sodalis sp. dw_96]